MFGSSKLQGYDGSMSLSPPSFPAAKTKSAPGQSRIEFNSGSEYESGPPPKLPLITLAPFRHA